MILIPGYGGDASMLDGLATRLRQAGRTAIVLALPDGGTGDLRVQAGVLATEVAHERAAGAVSVDLVGYSAGGIVAGLYVTAHPLDVRRIVTIGSPLHGTELASLAAGLLPSSCPVACQQMVPGSAVLASLAAAVPARTGVRWLSMWSADDEVVHPPDSARLTGADNIQLQTICADDDSGHLDLPDDPLVKGLVLAGVGTGELPSAAPSGCAALRASGSA